MGLHEHAAEALCAGAAGLCLAYSDWHADREQAADRKCARPPAAHQGQPSRSEEPDVTIHPVLSMAAGMAEIVSCLRLKAQGGRSQAPWPGLRHAKSRNSPT